MECVVNQMDVLANFCSAVKQIVCIGTSRVKSLDEDWVVNETNIKQESFKEVQTEAWFLK